MPAPEKTEEQVVSATYEILPETYTKIDYLRDTICLNPGIMYEIFKREYSKISDPNLAEEVYREFLTLSTYLSDQKKLIMADRENKPQEDAI